MKNKLIVIGNFGVNGGKCGQTIKTNVVFNLFRKESQKEIVALDTLNILNPLKFMVLVFSIFKYKNFIILPGISALPVLAFLFEIFNKRADYIVIGGWLPEYLTTTRKWIRRSVTSNFKLFVETNDMSRKLKNIDVESYLLPNFKNFKKIKCKDALLKRKISPMKKRYAYLSRVVKEKGILDSLRALHQVSIESKNTMFYFDIYGPLDNTLEIEFEREIESVQTDNLVLSYKGFISPNDVQDTLTKYDFFMFPTYYEGEGFPGCLVDAFSAGVPVIASDWKYNNEVVTHSQNGFLHKSKNIEHLVETIRHANSLSTENYNSLVSKCLSDALEYHEDNIKLKMREFGLFA